MLEYIQTAWRKLFEHTIAYLYRKHFSISDREVWRRGFLPKSLCFRKACVNKLIVQNWKMHWGWNFLQEKIKCMSNWNHMLWVMLFNFPVRKHIAQSFLLVYSLNWTYRWLIIYNHYLNSIEFCQIYLPLTTSIGHMS